MDEKPHLSHSQIAMYLRCPELYFRVYIKGERKPPGIAAHIGTGVHDAARANFAQKIESHADLPPSEFADIAVACLDGRIEEQGIMLDGKKSMADTIGLGRDDAARLAKFHAVAVAPNYQPTFTEERVRVVIPNSTHDLVGVLDLVDDKQRVADFKTTGRKKNQREADTSLQLTAYAVMHARKFGQLPASLLLDVTLRKAEPSNYVLQTTRTLADVAQLARVMNAVLHGIKSGSFPPTLSSNWWCAEKWCAFALDGSCPYFKK